MAIITLPYQYLERLVGTDHETILARLPMIGSDIERVETDHADVEFFPDRPDLFSPEGVARAMKGFLGIETGLAILLCMPLRNRLFSRSGSCKHKAVISGPQ